MSRKPRKAPEVKEEVAEKQTPPQPKSSQKTPIVHTNIKIVRH
jgi:hypothetical protein